MVEPVTAPVTPEGEEDVALLTGSRRYRSGKDREVQGKTRSSEAFRPYGR